MSADFLRGLEGVPSELRSADWERVPLWMRERSFFMSEVSDAEVLDLFHREAISIAGGVSTNDESARRIRAELDRLGYEPTAGAEGTIKDLRSLRRINIALDTNVAQARGYAEWLRAQDGLLAFPAWRYLRGAQRVVPRDWPGRWRAALAVTMPLGATGGENTADMVALVNHPLWRVKVFNYFGSAWPPFDWNSGMTVQPVSRAEAMRLGLLPPLEDGAEAFRTTREMLRPAPRVSMNEGLQAHPDIENPRLREALAKRLQGFARWEDDSLIFTDPNGTRPGSPEVIGGVIASPLPVDPVTGERFRQLQAEALDQFAADPIGFGKGRHMNRWTDFARLLGRVSDGGQRDAFLRAIAEESILEAEGLAEFIEAIPALVGSAGWRAALEIGTARLRYGALLRVIVEFLNG